MTVLSRIPAFALLVALAGCATGPVAPGQRSPAEINAELGLNYLQKGEYETALAKLKKSLAEDPRRAETHHYLAELYRRTGDPRNAERSYRTATRLAPRDARIWRNYAVFLCKRRKYDDAQRAFDQAFMNYHGLQRSAIPEQAGLCALQAKDWALAERRFRAALDEDPRAANALYQLARLMQRKGDYLHARAFLERLMEVHEQDRTVLELAIEIETALGDHAAVADYRRRLEAMPVAPRRQDGRTVPAEEGGR